MGLASLIPARSTLAGGLTSLAVWGIGLALTAAGVVIPPLTVAGIGILTQGQMIGLGVAIAGAIATHVMPDSLTDHARDLDIDVKKLAKAMPQLYYGANDFPGHVAGPQSPNNLNQGQ